MKRLALIDKGIDFSFTDIKKIYKKEVKETMSNTLVSNVFDIGKWLKEKEGKK